ncbi:MAG: DNA mismatch repair endonuclease MutL [Ruminococcaceae bacterium]|nr:DNA mismatch repair endonuclease MutL [Oscillospiraceae bacterium]
MGKINVLPFAVANLIAAGEVVDRPASVIKELMENAIDAGATRITVEIQNGGVTFMRVSDNGCGIDPEDLPTAIRRHATSKIQSAEDLDGILTLGFRGEALAAIASVSDMRILSKTPEAEFGTVLEAHGGEIIGLYEQGCSTGTSVIVENLFANVPARRKFLKKDVTESMAVTANVEKVALSHPEIAFRLIVDGNTKLETAGDGNLQNTVYAVFGKEFASRLIEVKSDNDGIVVKGFIGRSDNFKANRNYQNFFINGRYVKSKTAMAALEQAYTSYMPPEKFPACVLFIGINPARVDVNVHPAKLEVKFSNEKPVFEAIYYTVRTALENNVTRPAMQLDVGTRGKRSPFAGRVSDSAVPVQDGKRESLQSRQLSYDLEGRTQPQPQARMTAAEYRNLYAEPKPTKGTGAPILPREDDSVTVQTQKNVPIVTQRAASETAPVGTLAPQPTPTRETTPVPQSAPTREPTREIPPLPAEQPTKPEPVEKASAETPVKSPAIPVAPSATEDPEPKPSEVVIPDYRIVGEVFHSYVIVETGDKMLLIDKHAAHERILFEQLKAGLATVAVVSQLLMLPVDVMMTSAEVEALKGYHDELEKIGFSLRYARNTVSADAIPESVDPAAVPDMLGAMAGRILNATGSVKLTRDILFEKALYQAACKAAIKAGRVYADEHIKWIVEKLMTIPDITFCPHGRPVALELSHHTLDRQFDRTGF